MSSDFVIKYLRGLTNNEYKKFITYTHLIMSNVDSRDSNYDQIEKEVELGVFRDIQAQRLPPNVKVPARRDILNYLKTVKEFVGLKNAIMSLRSPGSWTSSGGSFKLAEDSGYNILELIKQIETKKGSASFLELGAGYAGLKSNELIGINKLIDALENKLGDSINIYFTNLTRWHTDLPNGVKEFPGYLARDLILLNNREKINPDLIYSQAAAYFEPKVEEFIHGASEILKSEGKLLFNGQEQHDDRIISEAKNNNLQLEDKKYFGENNGNFYVFKK